VVAEHDRLQAQLCELYQRDQAARGEWIAGGRIENAIKAALESL
jgi:hypothetical protein